MPLGQFPFGNVGRFSVRIAWRWLIGIDSLLRAKSPGNRVRGSWPSMKMGTTVVDIGKELISNQGHRGLALRPQSAWVEELPTSMQSMRAYVHMHTSGTCLRVSQLVVC